MNLPYMPPATEFISSTFQIQSQAAHGEAFSNGTVQQELLKMHIRVNLVLPFGSGNINTSCTRIALEIMARLCHAQLILGQSNSNLSIA